MRTRTRAGPACAALRPPIRPAATPRSQATRIAPRSSGVLTISSGFAKKDGSRRATALECGPILLRHDLRGLGYGFALVRLVLQHAHVAPVVSKLFPAIQAHDVGA